MADLFTGIDFMEILTELKAVIPIVTPVIIGLFALRKGWSFLKSNIKGA